jgi:hypothetical protein
LTLEGVVSAVVGVLLIGIALLAVILLVILANRHLAGRKGRLDGLSGGVVRAARANALRAGVPPSDDLDLHAPPRPDGMQTRRRKRR